MADTSTTTSTSAAAAAESGELRAGAAGPEARGAFWQATQQQLWLVAGMAHVPDTALAGLGLDRAALDRLSAQHAQELAAWRLLQGAARLLPRSATAELLRCRVNGMALAARTPAELAAVARTVKTLPDWVWDEALVAEDGGALDAAQRPPGALRNAADNPLTRMGFSRIPAGDPAYIREWQETLASSDMTDCLPLNRAQRRAIEARLRKGR